MQLLPVGEARRGAGLLHRRCDHAADGAGSGLVGAALQQPAPRCDRAGGRLCVCAGVLRCHGGSPDRSEGARVYHGQRQALSARTGPRFSVLFQPPMPALRPRRAGTGEARLGPDGHCRGVHPVAPVRPGVPQFHTTARRADFGRRAAAEDLLFCGRSVWSGFGERPPAGVVYHLRWQPSRRRSCGNSVS